MRGPIGATHAVLRRWITRRKPPIRFHAVAMPVSCRVMSRADQSLKSLRRLSLRAGALLLPALLTACAPDANNPAARSDKSAPQAVTSVDLKSTNDFRKEDAGSFNILGAVNQPGQFAITKADFRLTD